MLPIWTCPFEPHPPQRKRWDSARRKRRPFRHCSTQDLPATPASFLAAAYARLCCAQRCACLDLWRRRNLLHIYTRGKMIRIVKTNATMLTNLKPLRRLPKARDGGDWSSSSSGCSSARAGAAEGDSSWSSADWPDGRESLLAPSCTRSSLVTMSKDSKSITVRARVSRSRGTNLASGARSNFTIWSRSQVLYDPDMRWYDIS